MPLPPPPPDLPEGKLPAKIKKKGGVTDESNLASRWLTTFSNGTREYGLIQISEYVGNYIEDNDWEGLTAFIKEALTFAWINSFMTFTRKSWTKQRGQGSQNQDSNGYILLADTIKNILKAEEEEFEEEE